MSQFSSGAYGDLITQSGIPLHKELSNPVNPILRAARIAPDSSIYYANLPEWPSPEQVEHATRVLKRRAALRKS